MIKHRAHATPRVLAIAGIAWYQMNVQQNGQWRFIRDGTYFMVCLATGQDEQGRYVTCVGGLHSGDVAVSGNAGQGLRKSSGRT